MKILKLIFEDFQMKDFSIKRKLFELAQAFLYRFSSIIREFYVKFEVFLFFFKFTNCIDYQG